LRLDCGCVLSSGANVFILKIKNGTFALRKVSDAIHVDALADGQNVSHAAKYPNYALFGTPPETYGGNLERLHKIRVAIDPEDVMDLAGGLEILG